MSFFSFFIAGAAAFFVHRYAVRRWLQKGKTVESCLNVGCAVFMSTFAALFLALPSQWSLPDRAPTEMFSDTMKKAEQGDPRAEYNVAVMYSLGEEVMRDKVQAVVWTRKSAEKGYPEAQVALGNMYVNGNYKNEGVPKDYRKGKEWIAKAAAHGHTWAAMLLNNMELEEKRRGQQK